MFQRTGVERDRARLLATCVSDAAMQPPHGRELRVGDLLAQCVWRSAERGRGLGEVILEEPRFCERRANRNLVLAAQRSRSEHRAEQLSCFSSAPALERRVRSRKDRMDRNGGHREEYTKYAAPRTADC